MPGRNTQGAVLETADTPETRQRSRVSSNRAALRAAVGGVFVLAACLALLEGALEWRRVRDIKFVQDATGVRWPSDVAEVFVVRDTAALGQGWISGHVRIGETSLKRFMAEYRFKKFRTPDLSFVCGLERLPATYQRVLHPDAVCNLVGMSGDDYPFEMVLDARNGSVWFNVVYPR